MWIWLFNLIFRLLDTITDMCQKAGFVPRVETQLNMMQTVHLFVAAIGRPDAAYERRCNSLRDCGKILQIRLRFDPLRPDLKSICRINDPGGNAQ